jgi:hypothetical protein
MCDVYVCDPYYSASGRTTSSTLAISSDTSETRSIRSRCVKLTRAHAQLAHVMMCSSVRAADVVS